MLLFSCQKFVNNEQSFEKHFEVLDSSCGRFLAEEMEFLDSFQSFFEHVETVYNLSASCRFL